MKLRKRTEEVREDKEEEEEGGREGREVKGGERRGSRGRYVLLWNRI